MTTGTDILDGKETILGFVLRHREFIIIALIGIVGIIFIKRGGKK